MCCDVDGGTDETWIMTQIAITGVNNSTSWCVGQPRSRWTGTFCTIYFTIESGFRVHEFTCLLCCAVCRCIRNFCSFLWARKWITASSNPEAKVNRTCYFTEYIHTRTHSFPSFACIKRFFCYFSHKLIFVIRRSQATNYSVLWALTLSQLTYKPNPE